MKEERAQSILSRLMRQAQEVAKEPVTSARALRLAMARSAERSVGLTLMVIGVTEEVMPLDTMLTLVDPSWMLLSVGTDDRLIGFAGLDLQARTAVVEVQTLGELRTTPAPERPITASDAALCAPFVSHFMSDFSVTSDETPLAGWTDDLAAGARFADARAIGMVLPECDMRLVRLSLDLATGERQGMLTLALPVRRAAPKPPRTGAGPTFGDLLRANLMEAPASLQAVLHRLRLPFRTIDAFAIGQTIDLPGVTVRSVRIEGPDGAAVAEGRLGQITGMRAVRIEARGAAEIAEMRVAGAGRAAHATEPRAPLPKVSGRTASGVGFADEMAFATMDETAPVGAEEDLRGMPAGIPRGTGDRAKPDQMSDTTYGNAAPCDGPGPDDAEDWMGG